MDKYYNVMVIGHDAEAGNFTETFRDVTLDNALNQFGIRWPDATKVAVFTSKYKCDAAQPVPTTGLNSDKPVLDVNRKAYQVYVAFDHTSYGFQTDIFYDISLTEAKASLFTYHDDPEILSAFVEWEENDKLVAVDLSQVAVPEYIRRRGDWKIVYKTSTGDVDTYTYKNDTAISTIAEFSEDEELLSVEVKWEGTYDYVPYIFSEVELAERC
jgi:hypothetical protein